MKDISLFDTTKKLYDILVAVSTGSNYSDPITISDFDNARIVLIQNRSISNLLPDFIKKYRDLPALVYMILIRPLEVSA